MDLKLVKIKNPFNRTDREISTINYNGETLLELKKQYFPSDLDVLTIVNGKIVKDENINLILKNGDYITFTPNISGSNPMATIAMIVVMIVAIYTGQVYAAAYAEEIAAGTAISAGYITAGIMLVGGILVSVLLPPPTPDVSPSVSSGNVYSWTPFTTQQQGLTIPKVYGYFKNYGNIVNIFQENFSYNNYLNALIHLGYGPIDSIDNFQINNINVQEIINITQGFWQKVYKVLVGYDNNVPYYDYISYDNVKYFDAYNAHVNLSYIFTYNGDDIFWFWLSDRTYTMDVHINSAYGYINQKSPFGFDKIKNSHPYNIVLPYKSPITNTTDGNAFDDLEIDLSFPKGFFISEATQGLLPNGIMYSVEIKHENASDWSNITRQLSGDTTEIPGGFWQQGTRVLGNVDQDGQQEVSFIPYNDVKYFDAYNAHINGTYLFTYNGNEIFWFWHPDGTYTYVANWNEFATLRAEYTEPYTITIRAGLLLKTPLLHGYYNVRVTRLSAEYYTQAFQGDEVVLTAIREVSYTNYDYPKSVLVGVNALANNQISGGFNFSCNIKGSLVQTINDGVNTKIEWSDNPAWVCYDILTQPVFTDPSIVFGTNGLPYTCIKNHVPQIVAPPHGATTEPINGANYSTYWKQSNIGQKIPSVWDYTQSYNTFIVNRYDGINPDRLDTAAFVAWANFCDEAVPSASIQIDEVLDSYSNNYQCLLKHRSASENKPGSGVYWTTYWQVGGSSGVTWQENTWYSSNYEKRLTFNGSFDSEKPLWESALLVASMNRALLVWNGITISIIIDKIVTLPDNAVQLFSMGNIIPDSFEMTYLSVQERVGEIEISYNNVEKDFDRDTITIYNQSLNKPTNKTSITALGVIHANEAWRLGKYQLDQNETLIRIIKFTVDIDALACTIGDVFYFQHDAPIWGLAGGRIVSASNTTVEIDSVADEIKHNGRRYYCIKDHTSSAPGAGGNEPGVGATWPTYWKTCIFTSTRARLSNVATIVTVSTHGLTTGDFISVSNMVDSSFNASNVNVTVTNSTTFSYTNYGANVTVDIEPYGWIFTANSGGHGEIDWVPSVVNYKSRGVTLEDGNIYEFMIRLSDDTLLTKTVTIPTTMSAGTYKVFTMNISFSDAGTAVPQQDDLFAFGIQDSAVKPFRVIDIQRTSDLQATIKASEYVPAAYNVDSTIPLPPAFTYIKTPSISVVSNITATEASWINNDGSVNRNIQVRFTKPNNINYLCSEIYLRTLPTKNILTTGDWKSQGITYSSSFLIERVPQADFNYEIMIVSISNVGIRTQNSENPKVAITTNAIVNFDDFSFKYMKISGLQIFGNGNSNIFDGKDCKFVWNKISPIINDQGAGNENAGAADFIIPIWFKDYQVSVYSSTTFVDFAKLLRTEYVTEPVYTYTYEHNYSDNNGIPTNHFTIKIEARDRNLRISPILSSLSVFNSIPSNVGIIKTTSVEDGVIFSWDPVADSDVRGYLIRTQVQNPDNSYGTLSDWEEISTNSYTRRLTKIERASQATGASRIYFDVQTIDYYNQLSSIYVSNNNWCTNQYPYITVGLDNIADFQTIQEALDSLPASGGGIYIKNGTYPSSAVITIPDKPIVLVGESRNGVIIQNLAGSDLFELHNPTQSFEFKSFTCQSQNISSFSIMFNIDGTTPTDNTGNFIINDIFFDLKDDGIIGSASGDTGIFYYNAASGKLIITNCESYQGAIGIYASYIDNIYIVACLIRNPQEKGIIINPNIMNTTKAKITQNVMKEVECDGIILNCLGGEVSYNHIEYSSSITIVASQGIFISQDKVKVDHNTIVINNTNFSTGNFFAIQVSTSDSSLIQNNVMFVTVNIDTLYGMFIDGTNLIISNNLLRILNSYHGKGSYSIACSNLTKSLISNNQITMTNNINDFGIALINGSDNNQGIDNVITNVGISVNDLGFNNYITNEAKLKKQFLL